MAADALLVEVSFRYLESYEYRLCDGCGISSAECVLSVGDNSEFLCEECLIDPKE